MADLTNENSALLAAAIPAGQASGYGSQNVVFVFFLFSNIMNKTKLNIQVIALCN